MSWTTKHHFCSQKYCGPLVELIDLYRSTLLDCSFDFSFSQRNLIPLTSLCWVLSHSLCYYPSQSIVQTKAINTSSVYIYHMVNVDILEERLKKLLTGSSFHLSCHEYQIILSPEYIFISNLRAFLALWLFNFKLCTETSENHWKWGILCIAYLISLVCNTSASLCFEKYMVFWGISCFKNSPE